MAVRIPFEYLKPLTHLRYSKFFQGEDALASSSLGIKSSVKRLSYMCLAISGCQQSGIDFDHGLANGLDAARFAAGR